MSAALSYGASQASPSRSATAMAGERLLLQPLDATQQLQAAGGGFSPSRSAASSTAPRTRVNPNSRTSAGFPLAPTPQQAALEAAKLAARQSARDTADRRMLEEVLAADTRSPTRTQQLSPFPEDPLTAQASEYNAGGGAYGYAAAAAAAAVRAPPSAGLRRDDEACAPEGSAERAEQKKRVNPLLDPHYVAREEAAALGYGVKHRDYYRYLSQALVPHPGVAGAAGGSVGAANGASASSSSSSSSLMGYRSKNGSGTGYRSEARALGWGFPHSEYSKYVSVRTPEDVLRDNPDGGRKLYPHFKGQARRD